MCQEASGAAEETVIIARDAAATEPPHPPASESQRHPFQFNTGLEQISKLAGLRFVSDTFTPGTQLNTD